jgi:hypothetical protein
MPCCELLHPRHDTAMIRDIAERQIVIDHRQIGLAPQRRMFEQRLQFRSEDDAAIGQPRMIKRLHPQPVARQQQLPVGLIVEREHEHAVQPLRHCGPQARYASKITSLSLCVRNWWPFASSSLRSS